MPGAHRLGHGQNPSPQAFPRILKQALRLAGIWAVTSLSAQAQFSIAPLKSFGSEGWLAPNGVNGSTYSYLTTADTERGLAYGSGRLYLVSRNGGVVVRVLDAQSGNDLGALNLGVGIITGGLFDLNMVAVGGDGAIYAGNLATGPDSFKVYQWVNDLPDTTPVVVYSGAPLDGGRLGDSLAATGSGGQTLLAAGFNSQPDVAGDNGYAIIQPSSGSGTAVAFDAVPPVAGDFRLGITFTDSGHILGAQGGPGSALRYTSFSGGAGTLLASPALTSTDERLLGFAVVGGFSLLASVSTLDSQVSLYDMTDPANPVLVGQANATTGALPPDAHNTGAVAWGAAQGNTATLYAMATDQGIQAFTVTVPAPTPPVITAQPQSQTVAELSPATFSVSASGNPAPTFQWYKDNQPVPGATDATFTIPSAAYADNGAEVKVVAQSVISNVAYAVTSSVVTLTVIADTTAPTVSRVIPASGSTVASLGEIEVHFDEAVTGVAAGDLLIDGLPATNVTAYAPDIYVFDFPQPPAGAVDVAWSSAQAITDLSSNSNRFAGDATFSYTLNPEAVSSFVSITEFMADNATTIRDEDGHHSDWLELCNAGNQPVDLGGWYLTDDPANLAKWRFPNGVTLLSKSFMLVWASGLDRTNPAAPLHTNFKLSKAAGSYLGLVYSDGARLVSSFWPYPEQYPDVSYGRDRLDPSIVGYFTNATPGAPNATLGAGFEPEVQFSVASGTFQRPFTLALTTLDPSAVIHYLLVTNALSAAVANVPNSASPVYTGPLAISGTVQVRARAFPTQAGYFPGPAHNETYFQLAPSAVAISSDLPIVVFHNFGGGTDVPVTEDQPMAMQVFETRNGRSSLTNPPDLAVQGYFHRRGQATLFDPKPNLRVETEDAYGNNLNVDLLGMPAENDWVFYGIDCYDKVLMHNPLTHELYREMGHYTSRTRYVEVYIKLGTGAAGPVTASDYYGLYVLEEKIKIGKNRVNINKLHDEDTNAPSVTGGYLLSIDKSNPGQQAYLAGVLMWYLDPDYFTINLPERAAQKQYIDNYFSSFYTALTGPNWKDPTTGYRAYIDLNSWIDYHLHQTFVFNVDMLRISAYFYKPRNGKLVQGPLWDFDRAFADGGGDDRGFNPRRWRSGVGDQGTDEFNPNCSMFCNPWYGKLFTDPDFWQAWIDRYQALRKSVYSLSNIYARIDYYGNRVREATTREYARWRGSGQSDTTPRSGYYSGDGFAYTFPAPGTWQGEIDCAKNWFSNRVDFMDSQFLNPPVFNSGGGPFPPGFTLNITAPTRETNSTIYYTLDGTDPRLPGGLISPNALSSLNTATITLTRNARVVARDYNTAHHNLTGPNNPPLNSFWSGPTAATFITSTPPLAITEVMYDPAPPATGTNDNDAFEFIELKNGGSADLNLAGIRFTNGIDFTFTATNAITHLGPGQYCVLVSDLAAFRSRYPNVTNVAGQYTGRLNNGGDRLYLEGALKEPILDFRYDPNWYPATQGLGFSLVIRNENAPFYTWTNSASWRASAVVGGSPGRADPAPANIIPVVINEALTHTDPPQVDAIELYNPTTTPAPIGGWFLTDNRKRPMKYVIPANTVIPAGGFAVFDANQFDTGPNAFALSSLGEQVYLYSGDGTNLTGYCHGFDFGAQHNGVSFGRYVTTDGREHFVTQKANSLGWANAGPKVGPVVINEIMYAPPPFGLDADNVDEYIELRNVSGQSVPLFDPLYATNVWRLDGAVQYTFPTNLTMPPRSYLLVVGFDPVHDPASLNWFRTRYGLDTNTPIFGPWQGHLDNQGETVALYQPDKPEISPSPIAGFVPQVLVEEVDYSPLPPWPTNADGTGDSLQRIASLAFGDDPANWTAGPPSPGAVNPASLLADTDRDGLPDEWEIAHGLDPLDATGNNGALGDPDHDGMDNLQEYLAGTDPQNPLDYLRFDSVSISANECLLQFTRRPGRSYSIQRLDSLHPSATWTTLQDNIVGSGPYTCSDPLGLAARFYRLRVALNP